MSGTLPNALQYSVPHSVQRQEFYLKNITDPCLYNPTIKSETRFPTYKDEKLKNIDNGYPGI